MQTGATFSRCRRYRYILRRVWQDDLPPAMFIGLNPSTADEWQDDPTTRRCADFARRYGCGGLLLCNLFAYCATHPSDLFAAEHPIGPYNDRHLASCAKTAGVVIAAWGNQGVHLGRSGAVRAKFSHLKCLKLNATGEPAHPLYVSAKARLRRLP